MKLMLASLLLLHLQCSLQVDLHTEVPSSCPATNRTRVAHQEGTEVLVIGEVVAPSELINGFLRGDDLSRFFIKTGGVYLLPEPVPFDATVVSFRGFGLPGIRVNKYLDSDPLIPAPQETDAVGEHVAPFFYVLVYRAASNDRHYTLVRNLTQLAHGFAPGRLPPDRSKSLDWKVQKGDYIGAYIPHSCVKRTDGLLQCPSQINLKTNSCRSAFYFPALSGVSELPTTNFREVSIFLNMEVVLSPDDSTEGPEKAQEIPVGTIAAGAASIFIAILLVGIIAAIVAIVMKIRARSAKDPAALTKPLTSIAVDLEEHGLSDSGAAMSGKQKDAGEVVTEINSKFIKKAARMNILIPAKNIKLLDRIGKGEYGVVHKGHLTERQGRATSELVAVKTLKSRFSPKNVGNLIKMSEKMMKFDHLHVVNLVGLCVDAGRTPYIIMPYMANGSILTCLRRERPQLIVPQDAGKDIVVQATRHLLSICLQIAQGMCYLAKLKVLHKNLAARNCMISDDFVIKVADYGLAGDVVYNSNNLKQSRASTKEALLRTPIRWMAPECLVDGIYTEKTDVWAYGVTCWEVFSLGHVPYHGMHPHSILKFLKNGTRLEKPSNPACTDQIYGLIMNCWAPLPNRRMSFEQITEAIKIILEDIVEQLASWDMQ